MHRPKALTRIFNFQAILYALNPYNISLHRFCLALQILLQNMHLLKQKCNR